VEVFSSNVQPKRRIRPKREVVASRARTDGGVRPTDIWENEGGSYSTADEPDRAPNGVSCDEPPAGLDWHAFSTHSFPGRRRHDLEAVKAYEAYRSAGGRPRDQLRRPAAPYLA
jgi:hypothetical protein